MNGISTRYVMTVAMLTIAIVITGALFTVSYQNNNQAIAYPSGYGKGDYDFGTISSIQNDENGIPAWVVSGHWKSNLASNQSTSSSQGNATSYSGSSFDAQVEMVRLDGSEAHTHTITNFVLSNISQPSNMTKVFNGTSTASLREGPVTDIPTSIKVMDDKVISIWLDPSKVDNHYGNTPIYGLIMDDRGGRQGYMQGNSTQMRK
jgi:hypothetical protein